MRAHGLLKTTYCCCFKPIDRTQFKLNAASIENKHPFNVTSLFLFWAHTQCLLASSQGHTRLVLETNQGPFQWLHWKAIAVISNHTNHIGQLHDDDLATTRQTVRWGSWFWFCIPGAPPPPPPPASSCPSLSHTIFHTTITSHTTLSSFTYNNFTHNFVTHHLSNTILSHTIFHIQ